MDENYADLADLPKTNDFYGDLDYDEILSYDKGFRTEETIKSTARDIAKENGLDEERVREELEKANKREQESKAREEQDDKANTQESKELESTNTLAYFQELGNEIPKQNLDSLNNEMQMQQNKDSKELESQSNGIENLNLQNALYANLALQETQQKINDLLNIKGDSYTPQHKLELSEASLESVTHQDLLNESLIANLAIKETKAEINELLRQKESTNKEQEQTQANPNLSNFKESHSLDSNTNENAKNQDYISEKLEALQEKLKEDEEKLNEVISKFSPNDIADLLESLYNLDKALSQLNEHQKEIAEENRRIREQELIALANQDKMEFVLKGINEMTDKYIQVEHNVSNMKQEKGLYNEINKMIDKKGDKEEIQAKLDFISKNHPNFQENYPKTFAKAKDYLARNSQTQTKTQGMIR